MEILHYVLGPNHEIMVETDLIVWAKWMEKVDRIVKQTVVTEGVRVSTVFLGLDHNFYSDGPPILFETMIFGGKYDQYQERYFTWEESEIGHDIALQMVKMAIEQESAKERYDQYLKDFPNNDPRD